MEMNERIQELLHMRDMSQADLCRATGLSSAKVSQIVTGATKNPCLSTLIPVAEALSVSLDYLVFGRTTELKYMDKYQAALNRYYESMDIRGKMHLVAEGGIMVKSGMFAKQEQ